MLRIRSRPAIIGIMQKHLCIQVLMVLLAGGVAVLLPGCGAGPIGSGGAGPVDSDTNNNDNIAPPASNENDNTNGAGSGYTLTVSVVGQGSTSPPPGSEFYAAGQRVTLSAIPPTDWQFVSWSGDLADSSSTTSILMDQDRWVTATFQPLDESDLPCFHLPWAAGVTRTIGQDNNGQFTHQGRFAWDISMSIGTVIAAVAPGRVIRVEDSYPDNPGGFPDDPDTPSNAVWIDHGGGFQAVYAHLTPGGARVSAGQLVAAGQCIGLSGNSGYSSGPHLHYEVLDVTGQSTPSGFIEVVGNDGVAQEGDVLTSQNELDVDATAGFVESSLPTDSFDMNGIELYEPTPPAFFYTTGVDYNMSGRVTGTDEYVCVSLVDQDTGTTVYCRESLVHTDANGEFDIDFAFPESLSGRFFMGVISGVGGVSGTAPIAILLSPAPSGNTPPTAAVVSPADNSIDFGESGALNGSASFDADGDVLSYAWTPVSGPPVAIADPRAASTTFTLEVGEGVTRVAFQLVVFDGWDYSLPALVEYEMADAFAVSVLGLSQTECADVDTCQMFDTRSVALSGGRLFFWVELLNVSDGDTSSVEILDAVGAVVLQGEQMHDESAGSTFLRIGWTFSGPIGQPGTWSVVYRRNGVAEATLSFSAF
ncbi:MAG: M23 family metallopeptidase [Phycisphaerae bacterium]|nr:M23 family metallopeptidase [Phycisphaerae bacterium]